MSFANPTPIKLGITGSFSGSQYRVVGRVVMGVVEGGQTYYWNEFNLEADAGDSATLVYEQTERGGEWRLFTLFEPESPITAQDAATKRAGDPINLDGTDVRVTLVEQSRVYFIEGKAPEGVEVGDVANYFNAEAGGKMDVVSWTGEEVECYHGVDLPREVVSAAFNIRLPDFSSLLQAPNAGYDSSGLASKVIAGLAVLIIAFAGYFSFFQNRRPPAVIRTSAPASSLTIGSSGILKEKEFRVQNHMLVEIALVGRKFERHEYCLANDAGDKALLVCGSTSGAKDWILFTPLHPAEPLTPQQAGAVRLGQTVNVDGIVARVSGLFQSTIRLVEGPEADKLKNGDVLFCFSGRSEYVQLYVRWNANRIDFFSGQTLSEKDVAAAFGPSH